MKTLMLVTRGVCVTSKAGAPWVTRKQVVTWTRDTANNDVTRPMRLHVQIHGCAVK
jgi:hypothetical protein